MYKSGRYCSWIEAGYDLFSREGQDGIQVERLARVLSLNKSGFYHYFGDRETYFEHLMRQHLKACESFTKEAAELTTFDPGFVQLMVNHKPLVLFNLQLVRGRHEVLFAQTYDQLYARIERVVLPLWTLFLDVGDHSDLARRYYDIVRDMMYSRMDNDNFTYEFFHGIISDAKTVFDDIRGTKAASLPLAGETTFFKRPA